MPGTVYIETTIPSYYCDARSSLAADIERTREWWDRERTGYTCFTSSVVLDELSEGQYPTQQSCLDLMADLPLLALTPEVVEISMVYQNTQVMPAPPIRDALHVALAAYYKLDYLLTWNCRHLANANKFRHLDLVNARLGLASPRIITPDLLRPIEEEHR